MRFINNKNPIFRLYLNLREERSLLLFAFLSSIINKILDLAPPVIIGLAVDIVVKEQNSWHSFQTSLIKISFSFWI